MKSGRCRNTQRLTSSEATRRGALDDGATWDGPDRGVVLLGLITTTTTTEREAADGQGALNERIDAPIRPFLTAPAARSPLGGSWRYRSTRPRRRALTGPGEGGSLVVTITAAATFDANLTLRDVDALTLHQGSQTLDGKACGVVIALALSPTTRP